MKRFLFPVFCAVLLLIGVQGTQAQSFEDALVDVGNIGLTITNAGFVGQANVRNNPAGPPSMEYPLNSGVEHLFEAGLWIGALRSDGTVTVRSGAQTASGGYRPGQSGYEFASASTILRRSTLPESDAFTRQAVSHLDYFTTYVDTASVLPGTNILMPDPEGSLGMQINQTSYAWNFPFTEYFVIMQFDIINISGAAWDSVYVGMFHDLVVRNINTTPENGSAFFNKGGLGFLDSLGASYAFNAGGTEESINTYGAISFLGGEWNDPLTPGTRRFFNPSVASEYARDGYSRPQVIPRWWVFSGGQDELNRPAFDVDKYRRMSTPYPNPASFGSPADYEQERDAWYQRLRTDGLQGAGNWIGLTSAGPFPRVEPGDTLTAAFAFVAALKPEDYQDFGGRTVDTDESRALLKNNLEWARRTYSGEDNNYNGRLDPGEDANSNGRLDRYLIPEPPVTPRVRIEFENGIDPITGTQDSKVVVYWDRSAEDTIDPVTGLRDFEGYRVYRSNPGDDRSGNILDRAALIAQFDRPGNRTGFNNGFNEVALGQPKTFAGDNTEYWYQLEIDNLLNGWQYLVTVTAFDEGDAAAGLPPFESSRVANAVRVFPGTPPNDDGSLKVGVYPNPYRVNAAWDGGSNRTRRLNFYNLPPRAEIRVYTLAGELVKELLHESESYTGDVRWFDQFSAENRILSGGEHAWDVLSDNSLNLAGGLYLFTVKNLDSGDIQRGKFVVIK